jgi:hypothetical protein
MNARYRRLATLALAVLAAAVGASSRAAASGVTVTFVADGKDPHCCAGGIPAGEIRGGGTLVGDAYSMLEPSGEVVLYVTRGRLLGSTRHYKLAVVNGRWVGSADEKAFGSLHLTVRIVESDDPNCTPPRRGYIVLRDFKSSSHLHAQDEITYALYCGPGDTVGTSWVGKSAYVAIHRREVAETSTAKPAAPTTLTLTVNGWTVTATKAKPAAYANHRQDEPLASETPLTIRATIDHPLPKGWKLIVYHNGDVLSQGNGVYYKVCEIDSPSTATSCEGSRPGRIGPFDDTVYASLYSTDYLAMHSDIDLHFNPA